MSYYIKLEKSVGINPQNAEAFLKTLMNSQIKMFRGVYSVKEVGEILAENIPPLVIDSNGSISVYPHSEIKGSYDVEDVFSAMARFVQGNEIALEGEDGYRWKFVYNSKSDKVYRQNSSNSIHS